jgi:hypothetical protein
MAKPPARAHGGSFLKTPRTVAGLSSRLKARAIIENYARKIVI